MPEDLSCLRKTVEDREWDKFTCTDDDYTAVRTVGTGTLQITGLTIGGRVTEVTINATTWTALPATPLTDRNSMSVQLFDTQVNVKVNYEAAGGDIDTDIPGFTGTIIPAPGDGGLTERFYNVSDSVILYAKCATGTETLIIEELA